MARKAVLTLPSMTAGVDISLASPFTLGVGWRLDDLPR
jgi:hypothetical protein